MDYFLVSDEVLDLPQKEPDYEPVFDRIFCDSFYQAVSRIAETYSLDYMVVRSKIIELYRQQKTFSIYGICSHALSSGYVVDEFKKLTGETSEK